MRFVCPKNAQRPTFTTFIPVEEKSLVNSNHACSHLFATSKENETDMETCGENSIKLHGSKTLAQSSCVKFCECLHHDYLVYFFNKFNKSRKASRTRSYATNFSTFAYQFQHSLRLT
ncbi:hypothetical protein TNCT_196741 [Trichonephila clavata]|uniref:Uncharacterized protein n=1 Tax=Trichonephila clavata TaxID=2740835 RepID=A0A8X6FIF5_TRICU|nr:hypothetical protein TNCT_196741 [Trichonephila clavata]